MAIFQKEFSFGGFRCLILTPENSRGKLVWFHGGGWMVALGDEALRWGADLAEATGLEVHLPDYPLARKCVFPESTAWCAAYWQHVRENADCPVYLGGDSAGAQMALCASRERLPEKAAFVYAVTTLLPDRGSPSWTAYQKRWHLSPRLMDYFIKAHCPNAELLQVASPLESLERIPEKTLLITAKDDILADQQTAFAQRFGATQIVYDGAEHVFLSRADGAEFRSRALRDLAVFFGD